MRILAFPAYGGYLITAPLLTRRKAFGSLMQGVSLFPGVTGEWLRRAVLQWVTQQPLKDACICFGVLFSDPEVKIGDGVYIGPRCDIGRVEIGRDTIIGSHVQIPSGTAQHRFDDTGTPIRDQGGRFSRIRIGSNTWIGSGALICADIGSGCVIGAGSVIVKPVPDNLIATCDHKPTLRSRSKR